MIKKTLKNMEKQEHVCKFEKLPLRITPIVFDLGTQGLYEDIQYLKMRRKGLKKTKVVLQCRTCKKYAFECPYCHSMVESMEYPSRITCPQCKKEFQVRWKAVPFEDKNS